LVHSVQRLEHWHAESGWQRIFPFTVVLFFLRVTFVYFPSRISHT